MRSEWLKTGLLFCPRVHLIPFFFGIFSFLVTFYTRLSYIPAYFWKNRDDGIITLSSAKHFVDYGFLGVSPSGEMVEAFSAPLQALIFGFVYWITSVGYNSFIMYQGAVLTAFLGGVVGLLFSHLVRDWRLACAATLFTALTAIYSGNFIVWHFSGMENCITHSVIVLSLLYGWLFSIGEIRPSKVIPLIFAILSFTRIDLALEVGGILCISSLLRRLRFPWRESCFFFLHFCFWWAICLWLKWMVFGFIIPQTASAQVIDPSRNLFRIFSVEGRNEFFSLISLFRERQMLNLGLALIPCALLSIRCRRVKHLIIIIFSIIGLACVRGYLFGGARLDPVRTVTYLSTIQPLLAGSIIFNLRGPSIIRILCSLFILLPVVAINFASRAPFACCSAEEFESIRCALLKIKDEHKIHRPFVANPDLGAISFHKEFNIYDFGKLANPALTRLQTEEEIQTHFFLLTAPDIVEITPFWRERNSAVVNSPLFLQRYSKIATNIESCNLSSTYDFYIRKEVALGAQTRERYLNDAASSRIEADLFEEELKRCTSSNPADCFYVARVLYRYLPEIRSLNRLNSFNIMLKSSPASELFKRFIGARFDSSHDPSWVEKYAAVIREFHAWKRANFSEYKN